MSIFGMMGMCIKKAWRNKQVSQNYLYEYILSPCVTTVTFCLMNKNQDIMIILAGVSVMILWSVNIFECAYMVIDEKVNGTLGNILLSPFYTQFILFSEALGSVIFNMPIILVVFGATYWIHPYTLEWKGMLWFMAAYFLFMISIAVISVLLAAVLLYTRSARGIMNVIGYPFFILSGLLVPVEKLPVCIRWISGWIPSSHAFDIFRIALTGKTEELLKSVGRCLGTILFLSLLTGMILAYTRRQALVKGTIDVY